MSRDRTPAQQFREDCVAVSRTIVGESGTDAAVWDDTLVTAEEAIRQAIVDQNATVCRRCPAVLR